MAFASPAARSLSAWSSLKSTSARYLATFPLRHTPSNGRSAGDSLRHSRHKLINSGSAPQSSKRPRVSLRSHLAARAIVCMTLSPEKGGCPVRMAARIPPNAKTSARASTSSPRACSGAIYAGVPFTCPATVRPASSAKVWLVVSSAPLTSRASPQSIT